MSFFKGMKATALFVAATVALPGEGTAGEDRLNFGTDFSTYFMTREAPQSRPLLSTFLGVPNSGDILNASAISPGWNPGFGVSVYTQLDDAKQFGIEAGGFFITPFEDNFSTPISAVIETSVPVFVGASTLTTARWNSQIYGFEANATYQMQDGLQLFSGLRYISLKETFDVTYQPSAIRLNFDATNNLFGPQIGVRADLDSLFGREGSGPFNFGGEFATGLLFNSASNSAVGTGGLIPSFSDTDKNSPFVRASLNVGYEAGPGTDVSFGYNALWIDNVAQVTDQVGTIGVLGTPSTISRFSDVLYHGAEFKITIALN